MSLEKRLSEIEHQLAGDGPVLICVVYTDDQPGTDPQPLTAEQIEQARLLFKQAVEADPGQTYYVVYLNSPA